MKTMITGSTMRIEPKGVNPYEQENLMRFMFTSNQIEDAVYLSEGSKDRRYTILEVSKKYTNDRKNFWNPYAEWCKNKDNLAKVHRFLLDWKIDWDFISMPLGTHAKRRMQEHSASIFHRWLANRVAAGHILTEDRHTHWHSATINGKDSRAIIRDQWCDLVNMNDVANCYNDYARNWNKDRTGDKNPQQILTLLRDDGLAPQRGQGHEVFKSIGNGVRRKLKVIASHDEFIRVLYQKYGFELDEFRIPEEESNQKQNSDKKEKF